MSVPGGNFSQADYPADFLAAYEPLECLSYKQESETLFVRDRRSGAFAVAKCYRDKALLSQDSEGRILRSLCHNGMPKFLGEYENDAMLCVVREYIKGIALSDLLEQAPMTQEDTRQIILQLCDILAYLHSQKPPVIHRDLKPQNIILTDEGAVKLIDFGISRSYRADAAKDTVCYGTQSFAPPEQYGFSQTDCRSDLFSLGVVMGYLLTGETDIKAAAEEIENKRLSRIYRKCTDFNPQGRYATAEKLKAALLRADEKRQKGRARLCAAALMCAVSLLAGFSLGRYSDVFAPRPADIIFSEPLIEQAVRLQLQKKSGEALNDKDLLAVTELYIFGSEVISATEEGMNRAANQLFDTNRMRPGPIGSLSDLKKLPNLKKVAVAMQQVSDLTPLASLPQLQVLIVKNNPIEDISPLCGLKQLEHLSAFGILAKDFSCLSACPMLRSLDAGGTPVRTPAAFTGLTGLTHLILCKHTLDSLDGINQLERLTSVELGGVVSGDLGPLLALPHLESLVIGETLREAAEKIAPVARFTITYQ